MTAEAEGVAQRGIDLRRTRRVRDDVDVHFGVEVFDVDRGRGDLIADGVDGGDEFDAAGGAEQVAGHRLGGGNEQAVLGVVAEGALDGAQLAQIAHGGRGGMRVDVLNVRRVEFGVTQGHLHALGSTETFGMRRGEVVGIRRGAITDQFRVDRRAAPLRMFPIPQRRRCLRLRPSRSRRGLCQRAVRHARGRHCAC